MSEWLKDCAMERLKVCVDGADNKVTLCPFCKRKPYAVCDNAGRRRWIHPNNECILNNFMFADNEYNVGRWNRRG